MLLTWSFELRSCFYLEESYRLLRYQVSLSDKKYGAKKERERKILWNNVRQKHSFSLLRILHITYYNIKKWLEMLQPFNNSNKNGSCFARGRKRTISFSEYRIHDRIANSNVVSTNNIYWNEYRGILDCFKTSVKHFPSVSNWWCDIEQLVCSIF